MVRNSRMAQGHRAEEISYVDGCDGVLCGLGKKLTKTAAAATAGSQILKVQITNKGSVLLPRPSGIMSEKGAEFRTGNFLRNILIAILSAHCEFSPFLCILFSASAAPGAPCPWQLVMA